MVSQELVKRLKEALAGRDSIDIGEFQWIKLDMVKAEAGDQWTRIRKKIYQVSQNFIEKRLSDGDVLLPCRGGFIVVLADQDGQSSADRVDEISQALNLFFLGDRILRSLEMRAGVHAVDAADLTEFIAKTAHVSARLGEDQNGRETPEAASVVEDALRREGEWRPLDAGGIETQAAVVEQGRDEAAGYREARWARAEGAEQAARPPTMEQGHDGKARHREARWKAQEAGSKANDKGFGQTAPSAEEATRAAGCGESAASENSPSSGAVDADEQIRRQLPRARFVEDENIWDDIIFAPCWDAKYQYITTNFCLARRVRNGQVLYGRDTLLGRTDAESHRRLDQAVAIAAQRGFQQAYADGKKTAIAIAVHYDTIIGVTDRVAYFSILQGVPQKLRKYFYLRVDNVPPGAPLGQMEELFRSMMCFGSNVLCCVPFGVCDFSAFANCGVALFGSTLSSRDLAGGLNETHVRAMMAQVDGAARLNAGAFLTGVSGPAEFNAALASGYQAVSGRMIGPETALPVPLIPMSAEQILKRAA